MVLSKLEVDEDSETEDMEMEDDSTSSSQQILKWEINYGYDDDYVPNEEQELGASSTDEGSDSEKGTGVLICFKIMN